MISKGTRVILKKGDSASNVPNGSLATVVDIIPEDELEIVVIPDCNPKIRLYYVDSEYTRGDIVEVPVNP